MDVHVIFTITITKIFNFLHKSIQQIMTYSNYAHAQEALT